MRIAILGSGGVGGYFGGRLAAAGGDVHFIARGAQLAALRERGLTIESPRGNLHVPHVNATDDAGTIGPVDLVFFTVKLYDTDSALAQLPALIGPNTLVIPFQNGVDSVERLTKAVGEAHVAGGTSYVTAVVAEPGVIRHTAMETLIFGPMKGPASASLEELRELGNRAGCKAILSERISVDIWLKFSQLSVFSGISSIARAPIGPVRTDPELRALMEAALHESIAVARSRQIPLPHDTFDKAIKALDALPPHARSSMLEDLDRGRRIELPWLSGAVVRIGQEVGVPTPTHRLFVTLLRPHLNGAPLAG